MNKYSKFLFDTWYGPFVVWWGVVGVGAILPFLLFDVTRALGMPIPTWGMEIIFASLGGMLFAATILGVIAWFVALFNCHFGRALVQLVLGVFSLLAFLVMAARSFTVGM